MFCARLDNHHLAVGSRRLIRQEAVVNQFLGNLGQLWFADREHLVAGGAQARPAVVDVHIGRWQGARMRSDRSPALGPVVVTSGMGEVDVHALGAHRALSGELARLELADGRPVDDADHSESVP